MTRISLLQAFVAAAAWVAASGCSSSLSDFSAGRYVHPAYDIAVGGADSAGAPGELLGSDWRLDNYYLNGGALRPKLGSAYVRSIRLDRNGDGVGDESHSVPVYDLRYENRVSGGVIWLSTFPIDTSLERTDLEVIARRYLQAVSGVGVAVVEIQDNQVISEVRRFATRNVTIERSVIDGQEAVVVQYELANVDEVQVDENGAWAPARVTIFRPPAAWSPSRHAIDQTWPVISMVGLRALPERFDADVPSYEQFIARVDVGRIGEAARTALRAAPSCFERAEIPADVTELRVRLTLDSSGRGRRVELPRASFDAGSAGATGQAHARFQRCVSNVLSSVSFGPESAGRSRFITIPRTN